VNAGGNSTDEKTLVPRVLTVGYVQLEADCVCSCLYYQLRIKGRINLSHIIDIILDIIVEKQSNETT
jgi:hypothetical protein